MYLASDGDQWLQSLGASAVQDSGHPSPVLILSFGFESPMTTHKKSQRGFWTLELKQLCVE